LNQAERERVIEMLLSQEKVISLLYEKTFPMGAGGGEGIPQEGEQQPQPEMPEGMDDEEDEQMD
jgi:hypothetical protein